MPGGLGPRFALEAGFLILLAAVATYAQLDATEVILVMAGGWLVASVFEVLAARRERLYQEGTWQRRAEAGEAPDAEAKREQRPSRFRRSKPAAPPEEAVVSEPAPAAPNPPRVGDEATGELEVPRRRRWFRRGGEPQPPPDEAAARPSARHVRLIRGNRSSTGEIEERKDAEAGS